VRGGGEYWVDFLYKKKAWMIDKGSRKLRERSLSLT
jgi:hypothetical protein